METAQRIQGLSSAIFSEMDSHRQQVEAQGLEVINLGIGSPDRPPAPHIIQALSQAVQDPANYGYPSSEGSLALRREIAHWYKERFRVDLDPETEVLVLMGSQDGLAHLAMAYINPGDYALIPDPGYPIYSGSITLSGGSIYPLPLTRDNEYLPDLKAIPYDVVAKAKFMVLNYPNNPISAVANSQFFGEVVAFAKVNQIRVLHDIAYSELAFDGYKPMSFLETSGAKEVGLEFHSFSKTFNMAGCRIGFAVGNAEAISHLRKIKSNIDYGVFLAVQQAAQAALSGPKDFVDENARTYQARRDVFVDGVAQFGWKIDKPKAGMFLWAPIPEGFADSKAFAIDMLYKTGVLVIPGTAFGQQGQRFVRIALTRNVEVLAAAVKRIENYYISV